MEKPLVRKSA